jgi:hypothetical protein
MAMEAKHAALVKPMRMRGLIIWNGCSNQQYIQIKQMLPLQNRPFLEAD